MTVQTQYGPLTFHLHAVNVTDESGAYVDTFTCEDSPGDFDVEASKAGWVRVGMLGGEVLLERAKTAAMTAAPKPARRSRVWRWLRTVALVVAGCVVVLFAAGFVAAVI